MKKTCKNLKWLSVFAVVLSCAVLSFAAGEKERMLQRDPRMRALKTRGVIGERANGLLGFVAESPADKGMVDAENTDRQAVYTEIAKAQGASVSTVAGRRALQIVEQAVPGDWLQGADGKWYRK